MENTTESFHLNELNRDSIGSLNHGRPCVGPRVNLFEELNAFALQPGDSRWQVGDAEGPVVNDMPAWADQPAARPGPDQNSDVVEHDTPGRLANKTRKLGERRPCRRGVQPFAVPTGGRRRGATGALRDGRTEVGDIPLDRAQRVLMIHVNVIEAFHLAGLSVLNQRAIWAPEIAEASLSGRLRAFGSHFEDLLLCRQPWQHVARHVYELAVGGVPHLSDFQALRPEILVVFARVRRIPAEMPYRGLGPCQLRLRWGVDSGEEQVDVARLDRLVIVEGRLGGRRRKRLQVVVGRSLRVHRIQVNPKAAADYYLKPFPD